MEDLLREYLCVRITNELSAQENKTFLYLLKFHVIGGNVTDREGDHDFDLHCYCQKCMDATNASRSKLVDELLGIAYTRVANQERIARVEEGNDKLFLSCRRLDETILAVGRSESEQMAATLNDAIEEFLKCVVEDGAEMAKFKNLTVGKDLVTEDVLEDGAEKAKSKNHTPIDAPNHLLYSLMELFCARNHKVFIDNGIK